MDPDIITDETDTVTNSYFAMRQELYCTGDTTGKEAAKEVTLYGKLDFEMRQIRALWYSGIDFYFSFKKQADKILITADAQTETYRIHIVGMEVICFNLLFILLNTHYF